MMNRNHKSLQASLLATIFVLLAGCGTSRGSEAKTQIKETETAIVVSSRLTYDDLQQSFAVLNTLLNSLKEGGSVSIVDAAGPKRVALFTLGSGDETLSASQKRFKWNAERQTTKRFFKELSSGQVQKAAPQFARTVSYVSRTSEYGKKHVVFAGMPLVPDSQAITISGEVKTHVAVMDKVLDRDQNCADLAVTIPEQIFMNCEQSLDDVIKRLDKKPSEELATLRSKRLEKAAALAGAQPTASAQDLVAGSTGQNDLLTSAGVRPAMPATQFKMVLRWQGAANGKAPDLDLHIKEGKTIIDYKNPTSDCVQWSRSSSVSPSDLWEKAEIRCSMENAVVMVTHANGESPQNTTLELYEVEGKEERLIKKVPVTAFPSGRQALYRQQEWSTEVPDILAGLWGKTSDGQPGEKVSLAK